MAAEAEPRSADMRQRIMRAAEEVFANQGYDAASISDISAAAGVNRALIYYYFKDKEDLYRSIVADGDMCVKELARQVGETAGTSLDKLRVFITLCSQLLAERHNLIRILVRHEQDVTLDHSVVMRVLRRIVTSGIESGEFRPMDAEKTAHLLVGIVHAIFALHYKVMPQSPRDELIDHAMSLIAGGIVNDKPIGRSTEKDAQQ
jgi:AcrR family transcriptional regulator